MSGLLQCSLCETQAIISLRDALTEGWLLDDGVWCCPSCAAVEAQHDRDVHEMIEDQFVSPARLGVW